MEFETITSESMFQGKILDVYKDTIRFANGHEAVRRDHSAPRSCRSGTAYGKWRSDSRGTIPVTLCRKILSRFRRDL
ncbi:MAG: hypothetical protein ACLR23_23020 [Clostridia bacterium]